MQMLDAQRAKEYCDVSARSLVPVYMASEKRDGIWAAAMFDNNEYVCIQSRGKTVITNCEHLDATLREFTKYLPADLQGYVIGELTSPYGKAAQVTADCITRKDVQAPHIVFEVHDLYEPSNNMMYGERWAKLAKAVQLFKIINPSAPIVLLGQAAIRKEEMLTFASNIWEVGREGAIFRDPAALYAPKARNATQIKLKEHKTFDLMCVGFVEGEGKFKGMVGSLICVDATGKRFTIGGGKLTDYERRVLWASLPDYNGDIGLCEVTCMLVTPDGELREPRFTRWRADKTEVDTVK